MRLVVDPIIYQVLYIPGGYIVGFLPSTVGRFLYFWTFENPWWRFCLNHPKSGQIREKVQSQTNDAVTNYSGKKKASEFPTPMNRKNQISWGGNRQLARPWKKKRKTLAKVPSKIESDLIPTDLTYRKLRSSWYSGFGFCRGPWTVGPRHNAIFCGE